MILARQNDLKTHAQSALDGKDKEAKTMRNQRAAG